ncbi:MAG: diguanylate cyclase [Butyrivibrio sp.]|nr:diguanylate cyclase [Butyrivibrio sp.]
MGAEYYLSICIHFEEGWHTLFYKENDVLHMEEIHRFNMQKKECCDGLVFDIDHIFLEILYGMKKCKDVGKLPKSVGITGWTSDYVLLDENDKIIRECYDGFWGQYSVTSEEVEWYIPESKLYSLTGKKKAVSLPLYQLLYDKIHREGVVEKASCMMPIPDYLHFLLCGKKVVEYTSAASSQLFDLNEGIWYKELIDKLELPYGIFCDVVRPGTNLGKIQSEIEKEIGYSCNVVVPCVFDNASTFTALPANDEHPIFIRADNYAAIGIKIDRADYSEVSRKYEYTNEALYDGFQYYKYVVGTAPLEAIINESGIKMDFEELIKLAETEKIQSIIDFNDSRFISTDNTLQKVEDSCREQGMIVPKTIGEAAAVVCRSIIKIITQNVMDIQKHVNIKASSIHVLGMAQDIDYMNQLIADETGLFVTSGPKDTRLVGNAIIQMMAGGEFANLSEARNCISRSFNIKHYQPSKKVNISEKQLRQAYNTSQIAIRCAKYLYGVRDFDAGVNQVLSEIGKAVHPDRVTIVGIDGESVNMLYEWTAYDIQPMITTIKNIPTEAIWLWTDAISKNGVFIQKNGEITDGRSQIHLDIIENGRINNILEVPLYDKDDCVGFLGVENFIEDEIVNIQELLETVSFFIAAVLVNERLVMKLRILSNTDMLTGVYNRNAMNVFISELSEKNLPVGVLYADVNGLKKVNDEFGHAAGDSLIKRASGILMQVFDRTNIFRAGGDEFVVIMSDSSKNDFLKNIKKLEDILFKAKEFSMAIGYKYTDNSMMIDRIVREADEAMYANKQKYYRDHHLKPR